MTSTMPAQRLIAAIDRAALVEPDACGPRSIFSPKDGRPQLSPRPPLNHSIFATDIAGFANVRRNDADRSLMRQRLYEILQEVFHGSGIPWGECLHNDGGDGTLAIAPATVSTVSLVDPLLELLAARLRAYNRRAGLPVCMQLRVALHVGPVLRDENGLNGHSIIYTTRMLDAPVMKRELTTARADLAFIVSPYVYESVICQISGSIDPAQYRQVLFDVEEMRCTGWMYLAGGTRPR
jgi:hypothetical protein